MKLVNFNFIIFEKENLDSKKVEYYRWNSINTCRTMINWNAYKMQVFEVFWGKCFFETPKTSILCEFQSIIALRIFYWIWTLMPYFFSILVLFKNCKLELTNVICLFSCYILQRKMRCGEKLPKINKRSWVTSTLKFLKTRSKILKIAKNKNSLAGVLPIIFESWVLSTKFKTSTPFAFCFLIPRKLIYCFFSYLEIRKCLSNRQRLP